MGQGQIGEPKALVLQLTLPRFSVLRVLEPVRELLVNDPPDVRTSPDETSGRLVCRDVVCVEETEGNEHRLRGESIHVLSENLGDLFDRVGGSVLGIEERQVHG
jgi:hypothetical protein